MCPLGSSHRSQSQRNTCALQASGPVGCYFGANSERITDPNKIPSTDTLILYILGHAIPDALVMPALAQFVETRRAAVGDASFVPEHAVAEFLVERRALSNTLLIWDVCFARSFEQIAGPGWTDKPYVHIFGTAAHEQAWHTEYPSRETLFSLALKDATAPGHDAGVGAMRDSSTGQGRRIGEALSPHR